MAKSGKELVDEAKARITEIDPGAAIAAAGDDAVIFLDVREHNEWNLGHVPGAVHIPRGQLENKAEVVLSRDRRILCYCGGGSRSALAADTLCQMGFRAESVRKGFRGWVEAGGEIED